MRNSLMLYFLLLTAGLLSCIVSIAQLPALNTRTVQKQPRIANIKISGNGRYVLYTLDSTGEHGANKQALVIKTVSTGEEWVLPAAVGGAQFSADSRYCFFKTVNRLSRVMLGDMKVLEFPHVKQFALSDDWLVKLSDTGRLLELEQLSAAHTKMIKGAEGFQLDQDRLVVYRAGQKGRTAIDITTLPNTDFHQIWEGMRPTALTWDATGSALAFVAKDSGMVSVWYYRAGMPVAAAIPLPAGDTSWVFTSVRGFTPDGKQLLLTLQKKAHRLPVNPGVAKVDVWNWQDETLQSQQLATMGATKTYLGAYDPERNELRVVETDTDRFSSWSTPAYVLLNRLGTDNSPRQTVLYFWKSGERRVLPNTGGMPSATGKYILRFSREDQAITTYEVATGQTRNLTASVLTRWTSFGNDHPDSNATNAGGMLPVRWFAEDSLLLIADRWDLWLLDPRGIKSPVNLTGGYGQKHEIGFGYPLRAGTKNENLYQGQTLLLPAFDRQTKENGFYRVTIGGASDPEKCTMGPFIYRMPEREIIQPYYSGWNPVKAAGADTWLVQRMSADCFPNYFLTTDFRSFQPITALHPEKTFNHPLAKLINFRTTDGKPSQAILYTPADFDSSRTYPIIFYFYEQLSNQLHAYIDPDLFEGPINIPFLISHGYLVCTPDIHYTLRDPGGSAYRTVIGIANELFKRPFIDPRRMGLQGHSFGGFEVNYIITHSNLFAAACAASAVSDAVSDYDGLRGNTVSNQVYYEKGQGRMGVTLWEQPKAYLDHSPVLRADRVGTPLLLMHNQQDDAVDFRQSIELFTALKRLKKPVWLLSYDSEQHLLRKPENQQDYTIRVMQFFDHYLKAAPSPQWMTTGVPATRKGIETGLGYEKTNYEKNY